MGQRRMVFFHDPRVPATAGAPKAPTLQEVRWAVDSNNPNSPFSKMVGQFAAKKKLGRAAIDALLRYDHCCKDISFLLTGPSSVGKTTLVKLFADVLGIPFVQISPRAIKKVEDVFIAISDTLSNWKTPLPLVPTGRPDHYSLPPCIIFVDEAHALRDTVQNGLLKAVESNDRLLQVESGETLDCSRACWIFATTETGDLFGPLLNRFCEINLKPYAKEEIAHIVQKNFPSWDLETCRLVAHYESRVPRKAIEFAKEMFMEKRQGNPGTMDKIAREIAIENNIDEHGLHARHLKVLKLIADKPVSKDRMALALNCGKEELERLIMPPLLCETEDQPAFVTVTQAGYTITADGFKELIKRGLRDEEEVKLRLAE